MLRVALWAGGGAGGLVAWIRDTGAAKQVGLGCGGGSGSFGDVPRPPFAYWASDRLRGLFTELPRFGAAGRAARQGMATADDFRFVRTWWAVSQEAHKTTWFPFAKGGSFFSL